MDFIFGPIGLILIIVLALFLAAYLFAKNYKQIPPNTVGVITGKGDPKTIVGGSTFVMPVLQKLNTMSLESFSVAVTASEAYSSEGVAVKVSAVGMVKFGSESQQLKIAVERFLTTDRIRLQEHIEGILAGNLRNIIAGMTVEELNSNREQFRVRVLQIAAESFEPIGMVLDVLTINSISDEGGYLKALGEKRTAQVMRDAAIGTAEAEREAAIAKTEAQVDIANAQRDRDLRQAENDQQVKAAQETAAQAGPLARAEAERNVELARIATEQQKAQAQIGVAEQQAEVARRTANATIIIPAQAARQAAVEKAEGDNRAAILAAQAAAEKVKLDGAAESDIRKLAAAALLIEKQAEADGEAALATAYNEYTEEAALRQLRPILVKELAGWMTAYASQLGSVDKITIIDNGGSANGSNPITSFMGNASSALPGIFEMAKAAGLDIPKVLGVADTSDTTVAEPTVTNGAANHVLVPSPQPRTDETSEMD